MSQGRLKVVMQYFGAYCYDRGCLTSLWKRHRDRRESCQEVGNQAAEAWNRREDARAVPTWQQHLWIRGR